MDAQEIITRIKDAGATTWEEVRDVLEDGEALAAMGITDEHLEAVEEAHALAVAAVPITVSETHSVDPGAMCGQGLIVEGRHGIRASTGCERQVSGGRYSQVFAYVEHPEHGLIAVTPSEFEALGLPEVAL